MTLHVASSAARDPPPGFLVGVAVKGLKYFASLLESAVAGVWADVDFKGGMYGGYTPWVTESVRKCLRRLGLRALLRDQFGDLGAVTSYKTLELEGGTPSPGFL